MERSEHFESKEPVRELSQDRQNPRTDALFHRIAAFVDSPQVFKNERQGSLYITSRMECKLSSKLRNGTGWSFLTSSRVLILTFKSLCIFMEDTLGNIYTAVLFMNL